MAIVVNFIAFQIGWLACVLGGARELPWAGTGLAAALIAVHLWRSPNPRRELILIVTVGVLGAIWDSLLVTLGWLIYPSGTLIAGTAPHWIVAMWMLFATTLNVSLRWLHGRLLLATILGAIGGPLAYFAGYRLGGVEFSQLWVGLTALGLGWAVLMPLLTVLAERFDGMRQPAPQTAFA
ncbi:MAG: DUF2878 domain-containing protein [Candidatus Competibacteraceae bacterium]|nr:DUF2878 domain-containing protein [Candidatus Competibacteraceae bacterium]